ncbi:hypothetical protein AXF42_Ash014825 [Apostasia shenzhenica]|uniref:Uncharacterized protein n=1 Tax=Apostasia shenzhenica TaxID=1088818 RepID=A0A2H9ZWE7_9ASPA|nr:hypothetical protein AXF42_Ash014825 [Apostasia shenzhenica]
MPPAGCSCDGRRLLPFSPLAQQDCALAFGSGSCSFSWAAARAIDAHYSRLEEPLLAARFRPLLHLGCRPALSISRHQLAVLFLSCWFDLYPFFVACPCIGEGGPGEFIHNDIHLEAGTCAVMVHHVMDESAPLYVPVDDITVLGPAVEYILPWPSLLILPGINPVRPSQTHSPFRCGNSKKLQETESICISNVKKMVDYAILTLPKDGLMFLVLHNRIFGSDRQIVFDRQDVIDFAKVNKIGASMISAYIG